MQIKLQHQIDSNHHKSQSDKVLQFHTKMPITEKRLREFLYKVPKRINLQIEQEIVYDYFWLLDRAKAVCIGKN